MESIANQIIAQLGAIGVLIIVLVGVTYLMYKWVNKLMAMQREERNGHKEERDQWMKVFQDQSDKSTAAIQNNTAVLSRIEGKIS